ncbi:STAS domain-containing protein [Nitrincola tapanii]|uniref:Anti-sigma factor antagonist n=1 Tax=Nitrincola tapanii TaxID=1708751 RepID=A0A5A9W870_9GAMM|nr:STAS domain-containing protein [Nitrincola tapanii]KAA0875671.1 anti-sigma factor antagonist [Nitrincola tapanii]
MSEQQALLKLPERFDFSFHKTFYSLSQDIFRQAQSSEILVDFANVQYLDSSALGMIVMLQKKAAESGRKVVLINARGNAAEILEIANMGKLVQIR